jgi:hypothetical protein
MNATTASHYANLPAAPARAHRSPWADPSPRDIEEALERMSVRINAQTAHRHSLNRAAQGVRTISAGLGLLFSRRIAECGHSPATYLTAAAVEDMRAEAEAALAGDDAISLETQRKHLRCAVWQGRNALFLLAQ